jgi:hypothetical protein
MKRTIAATVAVIVLALAGLRTYGAYQHEQDAALARATKDEAQATQLEKRLQNQSDCNLLWMKYESALTEKRIAELEGRIGSTPIEPYCTGYAPRMDRAMDDIQRTYNVTMAAITARKMAKTGAGVCRQPKVPDAVSASARVGLSHRDGSQAAASRIGRG